MSSYYQEIQKTKIYLQRIANVAAQEGKTLDVDKVWFDCISRFAVGKKVIKNILEALQETMPELRVQGLQGKEEETNIDRLTTKKT